MKTIVHSNMHEPHGCRAALWELERRSKPFGPGSVVQCSCGTFWEMSTKMPTFRRSFLAWSGHELHWVRMGWWRRGRRIEKIRRKLARAVSSAG